MVKMKYGIAPKKGYRAGNLYTFINIPCHPGGDDDVVKYTGNSEMNKMKSLYSRTQRLLGNILIPLSESTIIIKLVDSLTHSY